MKLHSNEGPLGILNFHSFEPHYSYKHYSYKKDCILDFETILVIEVTLFAIQEYYYKY